MSRFKTQLKGERSLGQSETMNREDSTILPVRIGPTLCPMQPLKQGKLIDWGMESAKTGQNKL